ncbi:hypothetical protein GALMADRAFT_253585 [Galerina marginata CBS 339.88]|uniref:F-box domain-containing protein n=1 Tax=Galerina marginata (strain CBS 339.88) TaxID=685588 RepID=A0A067SP52_GALM3|nr:hypothetical protein GALMADRAFT_253585 [Galerina marginata CBS 339.88]
MERALQVEEILHQIFDNLLPEFDMKRSFIDSTDPRLLPKPDKPTRATLLSAALTCRSFVEPALDALWWAMDDLRPLLSLLPSFKLDDDLPDEVCLHEMPLGCDI